MDIQTAGTFLGATILFGFSIGFVGMVIIFLNNMIYKYWKPLNWYGKYFNLNDDKNIFKDKQPTLEEAILNKEIKNSNGEKS